MKKENSPNETFLSDWMAGNLSDEQLQQLVSKADFIAYKKLKSSLQSMQLSEPDLEQHYAAIKSKRIAQLDQKPTKVFSLYRYAVVAAMVVLLFGLFGLFILTNTVNNGIGITGEVALNDNSHVTLNAQSKLAYHPYFFKYRRTLQLEGEAFFEVTKGSTFIVETPQGKVQVVGTKFNIIARPDFFEVVCYEGKVKVSTATQTKILTLGDAVRFYQNQTETWQESTPKKPLWTSGESSFKNLPLQFVIDEFRNQYRCEVEFPSALQHIRFSGSFTNKDIDIALQSICIPLHLKYQKTTNGTIVISE